MSRMDPRTYSALASGASRRRKCRVNVTGSISRHLTNALGQADFPTGPGPKKASRSVTNASLGLRAWTVSGRYLFRGPLAGQQRSLAGDPAAVAGKTAVRVDDAMQGIATATALAAQAFATARTALGPPMRFARSA